MKNYLFILFMLIYSCLMAQSVELKIKLKGINNANVSLQPYDMGVVKPAILKQNNVQNNEVVTFQVSEEYLPGEFIVRYDYTQIPGQSPYPAEQRILVNKQHLTWSVNPPYCNNSDSTFFQSGEIENSLLKKFNEHVASEKSKIDILLQFLLGYDRPQNKVFKLAEEEYISRCNELNKWIFAETEKNKNTFVKSFFQFSLISDIEFTGNQQENVSNILDHYFDEINFNDSSIVKVVAFTTSLNNYVNLSTQNATLSSQAQLDDFYKNLATSVIEKAKTGHPLVYGFVVDYFFLGFEKNNLGESMKALASYLGDPNCKTFQRLSIEKRLKGMKTLIVGSSAPNFDLLSSTDLHSFNRNTKYKLVLFWSADCEHCETEIKTLYPLYEKYFASGILDVVAVSIDESEYEINKWESTINALSSWYHIRPQGGIQSEPAKEYFILSTPSMFLVNSQTNILEYIPRDAEDLANFLKEQIN